MLIKWVWDIMDKHVIEALGKARVTVQDGKVVDVEEPKIEYWKINWRRD